jgi:hypothetical protein
MVPAGSVGVGEESGVDTGEGREDIGEVLGEQAIHESNSNMSSARNICL